MFKRVVITSGPTREPIDPVRYLSNRSSGRSGYYLAVEAANRDIDEVIFITGPTNHIPNNVTVIMVETALEMQQQLQNYSQSAEVILCVAAVSDYRVESYSQTKIKKGQDTLELRLVRNPDLLLELGRNKPKGQILVGYAAETDDIFENAQKKFQNKNLDFLVLNEISQENPAFSVDKNQVHFLTDAGFRTLEAMEKKNLAARIWDEIVGLKRISLVPHPPVT